MHPGQPQATNPSSCDVNHPIDRAALARDVTAPPKDCSTTPGLTNEVPGPPRNPSSSNVNHPINSVTRAGDVIAPSKEYGITPRVTNEIPLLGKPGPPSLLDEENMPSSEIPQPALGWVPEQSSNGTISKERRCPLPRECRAEDVCMLHISPPMPQPELPPDRVGVFPVLDCPHASDSMGALGLALLSTGLMSDSLVHSRSHIGR
jgi:hypothetical protein